MVDSAGQACTKCHVAPMPWGRAAAVFAYAGTGKRLVLAFKHYDRVDLAPHLARWLAQAGGDILARADIIAPVPLHWRRTQSRRYNQSAELVRHLPLPKTSQAKRMFSLLARPLATQSQEGLSRAARHENLRGKIIATPRHAPLLRGANVVLVDDVLTTGATLSAATKACLAHGAASVSVLVLARVAPHG
ncbi:MAG: ComF family protein [Paracoccaceae bacterium]